MTESHDIAVEGAERRRSSRLLAKDRINMADYEEEYIDSDEVEEEVSIEEEDDISTHQPFKRRRRDTCNRDEEGHSISLSEEAATVDSIDDSSMALSSNSKSAGFKLNVDPNYKIDLEAFDGHIIQRIMCFLPTPRDLYNISRCNKRIASFVTYQHIIRSAVIGGDKHTNQTVKSLVKSIDQKHIYVPSKARLLRLVNGKCCERGTECMSHNLLEHKNPKVQGFVCSTSGLFVCYECYSVLLSSFRGDLAEWARGALSLFSWSAPVQETHELGTGDLIGPYITLKDFKQLHNTFSTKRGFSPETRKDRLKEIHNGKIDQDPRACKAELFKDILDTALADFASWEERQRQEQLAPAREKSRRKLAKVQTIHQYLITCLPNAPNEWKPIVLDCEWKDPDLDINMNGKLLTYKCFLVEQMMRRYITAPSSFTKKALKGIAQDLCRVFLALFENNFFTYSFLNRTNRWEDALRVYSLEHMPTADIFLQEKETQFHTYDSRMRRDAIMCDDFKRLMVDETNLRDAFACYIGWEVDSATGMLSEVFAQEAHDKNPIEHPYFSQDDFRALARKYYKQFRCENRRQEMAHPKTMDQLLTGFEYCSILYQQLKNRVMAYLSTDLTREFIEDNPDGYDEFSRQEVVRLSILRKSPDQVLLMEGNFIILNDRHNRYFREQHFRWGSSYYMLRERD